MSTRANKAVVQLHLSAGTGGRVTVNLRHVLYALPAPKGSFLYFDRAYSISVDIEFGEISRMLMEIYDTESDG